ncbi:recombinase family protein [Priestia aryabhattai]|uniref:recombinase family protein n=1 Tax=Priestia aryabhattai TaxID=412384 RepID=UPI0039A03BB1
MKVVLYARVSTTEQAEEGYSIDSQLANLRKFAESQNWEVIDEYVDEGFSAKNLKRPSIEKLMNDVPKKKFDVVLVYKLDRLVRSVLDLHNLLNLFDKHGVMFRSATEMFDTTSAMGRFFISIVGSMAAWERENLGERVFVNMKHKAEEGKRPGGKAPFGYDASKDSLVINEEEAKWVRWIFNEYRTKGKDMISFELNSRGVRTKNGRLWSNSVLDYLINNPVYAGYIRWNRRDISGKVKEDIILVKGDHEPIISQDVFDEAQRVQKKRYVFKEKGNKFYPFTGILKCERCGMPLYAERAKRKNGYRIYYKCSGRFNHNICKLPVIPTEVIESEFLRLLKADVLYSEPEKEIDTSSIQKQLRSLERKIERLKELYIEGDIEKEDYNVRIREAKQKELALWQTLDNNTHSFTKEQFIEIASNIRAVWQEATDEERKKAVHAIMDYIYIDVTKESQRTVGSLPEIAFTRTKVLS